MTLGCSWPKQSGNDTQTPPRVKCGRRCGYPDNDPNHDTDPNPITDGKQVGLLPWKMQRMKELRTITNNRAKKNC